MLCRPSPLCVLSNPQVVTGRGHVGVIEGSFGKSGKFKVVFREALSVNSNSPPEERSIVLRFKRYIFDSDRKRKPVQ